MNTNAKSWSIAAVLALATLAVLTVVAQRPTRAAGPWYVAPSGSDSNDCLSPATTCATINGAIGKASSGDTIKAATGIYTNSTSSEVVSVTKSINLSGGWDGTFATQAGASMIDGSGARRGMTINNGITATVDGFVIQNGYSYDGGGVYVDSGTLTLNNSTISGNTAYSWVGGIYNRGTLIMNNSIVSGNTGSNGGGIGNSGALTLNSSTVSDNTGGIGNFNGGIMTLNNSTVSSNRGSGIANFYGAMILNNSTVSSNKSSYSGGGIYIQYGATLTLTNSILAGNDGTAGPDCYGDIISGGYNLIGNTAGCNFTSTVGDLTNISPNLGQLIGSPAYLPLLAGSPAIDAGNPTGCKDNLGNILNMDERGATRVGRCDIGAFEYTIPGPAAVISVLSGTPQRALPFSAFALPLQATVLDSIGSPVSDTLVTFFAPINGASGVFADSGTFSTTAMTNESGFVTSTTFIANGVIGNYTVTATASGIITPANFLLSNVIWYVAPGGSDNNDCLSPITPCATINGAIGKAIAGDTIYVAIGTYSELVSINKSVTISGGWDTKFTTQNGASTIDGGGIRRGITVNGSVTVIVASFVVQNGYSSNNGGAIYNYLGILTLNNSTVTSNTTSGNSYYVYGGGIYNAYGILTLNNSTVSGNIANYYYGAGGGGIYNAYGILTLNNSTVSGNITNGGGGGIYSAGTSTLNNSTVNSNIASDGGGIYIYAGTSTLNNSTVSGNITNGGYGGGIINYGTLTLRNSILAGNAASPASGAGADCTGAPISSAGYNLIGNTTGCVFNATTGDLLNVDPKLWLSLLGSPGAQPLLPGSPAIDAGNPTGCKDNLGNVLSTDEQGRPRVGRCDIGAYEFDPNNNPIRQIFLSSIRRPRRRIYGQVTENGVPATGVPLDLRFYDGANWSTLASTTTANDGSYQFLNEPNLAAGQEYYVRYQNTAGAGAMPNRLWVWGTRELTAYGSEEVNIGNFDLANIALVAPNDSDSISLPYTFQWTPRPATPSDIYEFDLHDPYDGYAYAVVGYTGAFTLNSLPDGFNASDQDWYWWEIKVYSPDGGYGISYESRWVNFTNTGNAPTQKPVHPLLPKPLRFLDEMLKH